MLQNEPVSFKDKIKVGCFNFVKGVLGIIFIGFLLNFFINRDNEHNKEYPWYGSIWYVYGTTKSVFGDKQFKTLEDCRGWAMEIKDRKNLKDGEWDYSCGKNCKFSDQSILNGRKVNTFECSELTK